MKKPVNIITIIFLFSQLYSFSQAFNDIEWYDVDSLLKIFPAQENIDKLQTLNALAASLSFENKDDCRYYAGQALNLAEKLDNPEGEAAAMRNFGRMEFYDGNYPKALNYYQESLSIYEALGNLYLVAQLLEDIATVHFFARNYEKTFELIHKSLAVYRTKDSNGKTIGDFRDTMSIYSRVGLPYRMTGQSDIARTIYLNYIHIGIKNNFEITDMMLHNGLLAMCYYELGNNDSAFYYFKQAENYPDSNMSISALKHEHTRRKAGIYIEVGNTDTAISLLKDSYRWFSERGFLKQSQLASYQLGEIYSKTGKTKEAEFYFFLSEDLLKEMISNGSYYRFDSLKYIVSWGSELYLPFTKKQMKEAIYGQAVNLYDHLYKLFLKKGQLSEALIYLSACSDSKDTLRVLTGNRESIEIQTRYESERKDDQIASLSQQNDLKEMQLAKNRWILFGLGGLLILILLLAYVLIRQNKLRSSQQTLLLQQRLLRTQMNPHFIFNSLASIQNSIINEEPHKASKYLARFSKLVRHILDSSVEEFVPLEQEISTIENYLELQKIRFPEKFDYTIEVDERLDTESAQIPPMLAQPFIENAIEHGVKHKESKGNINVRFKLKEGMIELEVEDDGIGRQRAQEILKQQDNNHKSLATSIVSDRIKILNKRMKKKISMEIRDLLDNFNEASGTLVYLKIPYTVR
ncbi:MAG: histidine kinase [Bacteroidales bacterium]|nr:histidine kinase [Bacteroidales bacterium]